LLVFWFLGNAKREKRAKKAKNEVFELKMNDIWIKKWASWGAAFLSLTTMF
jgi:hypothetical protein